MSWAPRLSRDGDTLLLDLSGIGKTAFDESLAEVKQITGRRFNPETKLWEFEAKATTAHRLIHEIGAQPTGEVLAWVQAELASGADEITTQIPNVDPVHIVHPLRWSLFPHQVDYISFMQNNPHLVDADDMGLGKTLESSTGVEEFYLRHPSHDRRRQPRLIIAPNSMLGRWQEELLEWGVAPSFVVIPGKAPERKRDRLLRDALDEAMKVGGYIGVNWEQVRAQKLPTGRSKPKYAWTLKQPLFGEVDWAAIIADEAHRAKNKDAQQTRGLWQVQAPLMQAATGTPILNSPDELWALLAWLFPEQYGEYSPHKVGYNVFYESYVDYAMGNFGKIITGVKNPDSLRFELRGRLVRRTKRQVLKDLPDKTRTIIPVELNSKQRAQYQEVETQLLVELETAVQRALELQSKDDTSAAERDWAEHVIALAKADDYKSLVYVVKNAAARMTRLRQVLESPAILGGVDDSAKMDAAVEIVLDHPEKPFVIFTKYKMATTLLKQRLERGSKRLRDRVATFTGDTDPAERTRLVTQFQAGDIDVLIMTMESGGQGITLTRADTAIFLSQEWTPALNDQAEDRLHRIGQDNAVQILILQARDTIDDGRVGPKNALKRMIMGLILPQDDIETRTA